MENKILEGKVALVTGAAVGIGRGITQLFTEKGAKVVIMDINNEKASQAVGEIHKNGGKAYFIYGDVRKWKAGGDCEKAVKQVLKDFGRIDILVNNAGAQTEKGFLELNDGEIENITKLNYLGSFKLMQLVAKSMIERKIRGSIINITSNVTELIRGYPEYSASKAALKMITKEATFQLGGHGIRVNCIAPGTIDTEMNRKFLSDPKNRQEIVSKTPLGRIGKPEDIAKIALFLASDESSFITGTEILVDGGESLRNVAVEDSRFPAQE